MKNLITYNAEVLAAIKCQKPVVALESTVFSHGLPYPKNIETAHVLEKIIRDADAIPAIIAMAKGKICVGLENTLLEQLTDPRENTIKASVKDMALVLTQQLLGATTVASTMRIAHLAGIRVFCTGGIGGVHFEAKDSFDISADLTEISKTPVVVVCSGAKSILDIEKTLEVLETLQVPVITYQSDEFPSFYSPTSGIKLNARQDCVKNIARLAATHWMIKGGGLLVANPIQKKQGIKKEAVDDWTKLALLDARVENVRGKMITPFLLKRLCELSQGATVKTNISLLVSNANLAALIAHQCNMLY